MPSNLFCYGTLQNPLVLQKLIRRKLAPIGACLHGYASYKFKNEPYPGLVPQTGKITVGMLYSSINKMEFITLDDYEGMYYFRKIVQVITEHHEIRQAWVYMVKPFYRDKVLQLDRGL